MKFKALFFDADNTIFDFNKASIYSLKALMERFSIADTWENHQLYEKINTGIWRELEEGLIDQKALKTERFRRFFAELGTDPDPVEAGIFYIENLSKSVYLMEGAQELLEKTRHISSVIVTNGIAGVQRSRYVLSGLDRYLKGIVISQEEGVSKPDPAIFDAAFRFVPGIKKEEILMVGDSLGSDILGANRAGIAACWFNPQRKKPQGEAVPDFEIHELSELPGIIGLDD